uniref:Histone-lysine N-methyltransferase SETMAR n=1 Tax=Arion vulgaris TaxID=1028688 RepID=A0A0B7A3U5_9EUPU
MGPSHVVIGNETTTAFDNNLVHPSYSPDLAPCEFFSFPKLKEHLKGNTYASEEDVAADMRTWFCKISSDFSLEVLQKLVRRWRM